LPVRPRNWEAHQGLCASPELSGSTLPWLIEGGVEQVLQTSSEEHICGPDKGACPGSDAPQVLWGSTAVFGRSGSKMIVTI